MANGSVKIKITADSKEVAPAVAHARARLKALASGARTDMGTVDTAFVDAKHRIEQFSAAAATGSVKTTSKFRKMRDGVESISLQLNRLQAAAAALYGLQRLAGVFTSIADAGMQMQAMTSKLQFATDNAGGSMAFLRGEADQLGLNLQTVGQSFGSFAAATKGTAIEGEAARKVFHGVATAATALHLSSEQTTGALRALEQMVSKGNVQAEELRGQLGERIPGAFNIAADAMGVTTKELNKMLQRGDVLASDLLPKLAAEFEHRFGDQAKTASHNLTQEINRMSTALFEFRDAIFSGGVGDAMTWLIRQEQEGISGMATMIRYMTGSKDATTMALQISAITERLAKLKKVQEGGISFMEGLQGYRSQQVREEIAALTEQMDSLIKKRNALLAPPKGPTAKPNKSGLPSKGNGKDAASMAADFADQLVRQQMSAYERVSTDYTGMWQKLVAQTGEGSQQVMDLESAFAQWQQGYWAKQDARQLEVDQRAQQTVADKVQQNIDREKAAKLRVIDIHSAKFAKIQALGQAAFGSEQEMLLAKQDADIAAMDVERQRVLDATALQFEDETARREALAGINDYYDQLTVDRAQQTADQITQTTADAAAQRLAIERQANDARLSLASGAMGALSTLLANGGRRAFEASKALAIGETVISTYSAAQKAYESQMTIPTPDAPVRAALAAGIAVAQGVARVAAISSQSYGSKSASASSGGASTPSGMASQSGFRRPTGFNTQASQPSTGLPQQGQQPVSIKMDLSVHVNALHPDAISPATVQMIADGFAPAIDDAFARGAHLKLRTA